VSGEGTNCKESRGVEGGSVFPRRGKSSGSRTAVRKTLLAKKGFEVLLAFAEGKRGEGGGILGPTSHAGDVRVRGG